jgi:cytochrome b subunit of formate dehydrogenase
MADQKQYLRFTIAQILEHWVLFVSFTGLAVTGLPQKFVGNSWAESIIGLMGGIEQVRTIHHICAVIMVLAAIYHVTVLAYKIFVLRVRWTMFPRLDDALDALDAIRYNLGLTLEHPKFDRFSFAEKAEYWALVWGTVIMGLTGFIMWNPITSARFLPGDLIPASKAAHGAEAILAVLAIIVWHFYNVHIKTFNKTVFTGKLTEAQMHEEHALELERIHKGKIDPRPSPEVIKSRDRVFIPVAAVSVVVMLIGVFLLTSFESTAVTPDWTARRSRAQVFAPITPTRIPVGTPAPSNVSSAKTLPADHTGRTTCLACHQTLQDPKLPADHAGRTDATCAACHKVGGGPSAPASAGTQGTTPVPASSSSGAAKPQPAGHERWSGTCLGCHNALQDPALQADHKGRDDSTCSMCHQGSAAPASASSAATKAPGGSASPASKATAAATPVTKTTSTTASSGPSAQPADHAGRTACLACHQTLAQPKLPDDHAGRTDTLCAACHKPQ